MDVQIDERLTHTTCADLEPWHPHIQSTENRTIDCKLFAVLDVYRVSLLFAYSGLVYSRYLFV